MNLPVAKNGPSRRSVLAVGVMLSFGWQTGTALAQSATFRQALAEAAAADATVADWYRTSDYAPLWTTTADVDRCQALMTALETAGDHGLPTARYDPATLRLAFTDARTDADRGRLEVMMTRAFLAYAHDMRSGVLVPSKIEAGMVREVPAFDPHAGLVAVSAGNPLDYLRNLPPKAPTYAVLMKAKIDLQAQIAAGGWGGKIGVATLKPGSSGAAVVQLRNRLIVLGYLAQTATQTYDAELEAAVRDFQLNYGLEVSGIASESTIAQLNIGPEARLQSVVVALERERWMNSDLGERYVWVNLTDFTAKIIERGEVTFQTRSVVGKNEDDRRTPEFSDQIEFMVVNPTWNVPRSISTREYLPLLKRNPNAVAQLDLVDRKGRVVPRGAVNFADYTAKTFPYSLRQAPSEGNALGLVKFMLPNPYNIYLHDTPSKSLFAQEVRDFSHGCIRLADPFDFAYALLARQVADPVAEFARNLNTGRETTVKLATPLPVHLVYFTAVPTAKGKMTYRRDVYGRDALIYAALVEAGVALGGVQG